MSLQKVSRNDGEEHAFKLPNFISGVQRISQLL
jgi:hypothetical protein